MAVAEQQGREARHGIVEVRDAVLVAGLAGDVVGEGLVTDARRAIGVDIAGVAGVAQRRARQHCDGRAQAVARHDERVRRVGGQGGLDRRGDLRGGLRPRLVEAVVGLAPGAQIAAADHQELDTGRRQNTYHVALGMGLAIETYSVMMLRIESVPLKETMTSERVGSVATKPTISVNVSGLQHIV